MKRLEHSWMYERFDDNSKRLSVEFVNGVEQFLEHAKQNQDFKDTMYEVRKKKKAPVWLTPAHFEGVQEKKKDPAFIRRSTRAKENRKKAADDDGFLKATHHHGSISTIEYVERSAKKNKGKLLSAPELFHEVHTRTTDEGERLFTSRKDERLYDQFLNKKAQSQKAGGTNDDNKLYYDLVGGHKHGKVYGLGSAANMYYEPTPTSRPTKSKSNANTTYMPGIYSQLQEEQEKRRNLEERFEEFQQEMAAKFAALQSNCKPAFTPQNRDPRDPSEDGGGGSNAGVGFMACEV